MFLLIITLVDIGLYQIKKTSTKNGAIQAKNFQDNNSFLDIYYIILDSYGREDVLKNIYGFDNSSFIKKIESLGFYVARESTPNYPQSYSSMSSSLNYDYLNSLIKNGAEANSDDRSLLQKTIRNNNIYEFLKPKGYSFVALPTIWSGTKNNLPVDYFLGDKLGKNELGQMIVRLTPLGASIGKKMRFDEQRKITKQTFQYLPEIAKIDGPTFTYVHILIPHPPFLFNKKGETAARVEDTIEFHGLHRVRTPARTRRYKKEYIEQLEYANKKILSSLDQILANSSTPPVIILQSDHGPGSELFWEDPDRTNMYERMSILNAYYLPEKGKEMLYPSITPVNSFRVVFNALFDADLELLEDRNYFARWSRPYDFIEVTETVRKR